VRLLIDHHHSGTEVEEVVLHPVVSLSRTMAKMTKTTKTTMIGTVKNAAQNLKKNV
jgi:hypothetical protein